MSHYHCKENIPYSKKFCFKNIFRKSQYFDIHCKDSFILQKQYIEWRKQKIWKKIVQARIIPRDFLLDKEMTDYFQEAAAATQATPATEGNSEHFWDLLHARLNSHCKAWSYKKKKKNIKASRKSFWKESAVNLQLI